jgi:hypothetical protein
MRRRDSKTPPKKKFLRLTIISVCYFGGRRIFCADRLHTNYDHGRGFFSTEILYYRPILPFTSFYDRFPHLEVKPELSTLEYAAL